jgi:predicted phage baseplate assembly protein
MPIEAYVPVIDDRRFDDIVAEARTRIARYTPEWTPVWTDVNDTDPGVTLVQLFAWMSDLLLYRLGRVPELNYLKFLELIGIELHPALPATGEIEFPVADTAPTPFVIVPMRTQVSAPGPDSSNPLVFETQRALYAFRAKLASLQVSDSFGFNDVTADNELAAPEGFEPFGIQPEPGVALLLGFTDTQPLPPQVELDFAVYTVANAAATNDSSCGLPPSTIYANVRLAWEYWSGTEWRTLNLLKDETYAFERSGHISFRTPVAGELGLGKFGGATTDMYWLRARIVSGAYERPPLLLSLRTNTVAADQAQTTADEVLGGSNGRPNQVFTLANQPVIDGTLQIEVDEGDGFAIWTPTEDFYSHGPDAQVYVLNRTTGEVRFGDGIYGAIPVGNPLNPSGNVVARTYRWGGGSGGNVAAGKIKTMLTSVPGIDENKVGNLFDASGGQDEERIEEAKVRAPRSLRSRSRAVTAEDFELLAAEAGNVKRAKALPLTHPQFPNVTFPGAVTVIIVPQSDAPNPMPSSGTIRTVCAYLNQRRLLTTELFVIAPTYRLVEVRGSVTVETTADLAQVKQQIEDALLEYLHPLTGGEDGKGWPFGGTVFFSRVFQRVLIPGVRNAESLRIVIDGDELDSCTDAAIRPNELVYSTQHSAIAVNYPAET